MGVEVKSIDDDRTTERDAGEKSGDMISSEITGLRTAWAEEK
jgi:hypothetical protein